MNDRILRALRREPVDRTPVWFMRQAGRALPSYRASRAESGMFEILRDPPRAAEVTMMPLEYFPVDALVLYNDLATPFLAAGIDVEMRKGVGPVISNPVNTARAVDALPEHDPRDELEFTLEAIRILVEKVDVPVLGFVGAPFTLCSYLVGGTRKKHLEDIKGFMWREPEAWHRLADYWARHLAEYGIAQHEAGAGAIQVFDSWAGELSPEDYFTYVMPHTTGLLDRLADAGVPTINFAIGNPALLPLIADAGGDCIGVDWRLPIDEAWELIGDDQAIQGNLDPVALIAGRDVALDKARDILDRIDGRPGHIFNLGHGILPETDHEVLAAVVEFVHGYTA
ncbi:MAG: uroporphyrinogen decarboxylase [Gemmatimonadetes bacterium]|nr:uroporphyrinogen decarboxylase [Gemmatimonadota bacterium]